MKDQEHKGDIQKLQLDYVTYTLVAIANESVLNVNVKNIHTSPTWRPGVISVYGDLFKLLFTFYINFN